MADTYKVYTSKIVGISDGGTGGQTPEEARKNIGALGYTIVAENIEGTDFAGTQYLPLIGGTLTGPLECCDELLGTAATFTESIIAPDIETNLLTVTHSITGKDATFSGTVSANIVQGAVWNDYAEYRESLGTSLQPGNCVVENGNDQLIRSSARLQPCAYIISDTFGFAIGQNNKARTPVAVAGRVLAYTDEPRENFQMGDVVCSGPNGTVSKMTLREIAMHPDKIIGVVSCVPTYDVWGADDKIVQVNNRIWIKLK